MTPQTKRFAFGPFILDGGERVLTRNGKTVAVPPKILELLLVLVESHGHVVEKSTLMDTLWPGTFVEESNLTFSIRKLRKILGDDTHQPQFIETVPKRGYRFVAETAVLSDGEDEVTEKDLPAETIPKRSLAPAMVAAAALFVGIAAAYVYFAYRRAAVVDWSLAQNVQLTDQRGLEYFPSLAPDGNSFVYAAETETGFDVFHQRVGSRSGVNLTADFAGNDTQPSFSPDGQKIAFRSDREGGGIFIIGTLKENLRRVSDFGYHPSWSPDGRQLAVSTFERDRITVSTRGDHGIWLIDIERGERRELYRGLASFPSWSPNGKRIAYWYYGNRSGQSDIATISAEGGEPVTIVEGFGSLNWNPVWSPDGKFLYFVTNRGGNQGFWRVRIDEETGRSLDEPEPVRTPSNLSRHLAFSRDGLRMIYVQSDLQSNIQGVEFDPQTLSIVGSPSWITEGDREVTRAELSPDGKRFQMRLIRRTQDDIVTVARDGTDWRDVTNDLAFDRYSRWSPDGRNIAFTSDRSGESEVWMISGDGGTATQITSSKTTGGTATFPVWSPDGSRLIFSSPNESHILDFTKPGPDYARQTLPKPENGDLFVPWDWSPNGKRLGGRFRLPRAGAGIYSFETGSFVRFSDAEDAVPSWLPDSRHVVFTEGNKIVLLDTVTLEKRDLVTPSEGSPRSPFVSRDGRLLYWVLHKNESDIWLLDLTSEREL